jgi:uncharacterized membrane protein
MTTAKKAARETWGKKLRGQFLTGLMVIIPLAASVWILVWLFRSIDNLSQPVVRHFWHHNITGVGFGVTVVLIYIIGVIARNVVGRQLFKYWQNLLGKVPVFSWIYKNLRQITDSFTPDKSGFLRVVLVDYPVKGIKSVGFVTNEMMDKDGRKRISVMIPNTPNPTSGHLQIFREEDVTATNLSVDDAVKLVASGGLIMPDEIKKKL